MNLRSNQNVRCCDLRRLQEKSLPVWHGGDKGLGSNYGSAKGQQALMVLKCELRMQDGMRLHIQLSGKQKCHQSDANSSAQTQAVKLKLLMA